MADLYLGANASAAVNLADGTVAYLDKGAKLPADLAKGEEQRLRDAGTPLFDKQQSAAALAFTPPATDEKDDGPVLPPDGEPPAPPAASVAEAAAAVPAKSSR